MITQKDVAQLAGVSVTTVSRVLNNSDLVDPETKQKVEASIKKLNYKPNLVAYGLRAQKSKLVGVILPELDHKAYAMFAQRIEEVCLCRGYGILVGLHHNECEKELRLIDEFQRRNVDGLIISIAIDDQHMSNRLQDYIDVPTVLYQYSCAYKNMSNVEVDNYQAGRIAADYLLSLGHRRFCCTVGPMELPYIRLRFNGFQHRLQEAGIHLKPEQIFSCGLNYQHSNCSSGEAAAAAFMDGDGVRPTAIWAHNDNVAAGIIRGLHLRNISVPGDVSVMGMDNTNITEMLYPSLTTVGQPFTAMAEQAVELLLKAIHTPRELLGQEVLLPPELIIRESTGPCPEQLALLG